MSGPIEHRSMLLSCLYFLKEIWYIFIIKWKGSTEKSIKDNTTTPNINLWARIQFTRNNLHMEENGNFNEHFIAYPWRTLAWQQSLYLGSSIVWTPTTSLQKMAITHDITQAKVRNFNIAFWIQKKIFWLEISMNYHVSVAVLNTRNDLLT